MTYRSYGGGSAFRDLWGDTKLMGGVSSFLGGKEVSWGWTTGTGNATARTEYHPDGKPRQLIMPTIDELEERGYTIGQCRGLMDHEASHVRFTNPPNKDWTPAEGSGWANVLNIMEDARVEDRMAATLPGSRDNLAELMAKGEEVMDEAIAQRVAGGATKDQIMLTALAKTVLCKSRYQPETWPTVARDYLIKGGVDPAEVDSYYMHRLAPVIDKAAKYTDAPSTTATSKLAYEIAGAILEDAYTEHKKTPPPPPPPTPSSGDGSGEGKGKKGKKEGESGEEGEGKEESPSSDHGFGTPEGGPLYTLADIVEFAMRKDGTFKAAEKREENALIELENKWRKSGLALPIYKLGDDAKLDILRDRGVHWQSPAKDEWTKAQTITKPEGDPEWARYKAHMDRHEKTAQAMVPPIRSMLKIKLISNGKGHTDRFKKRGGLDGSRVHALAAGTSDRIFQRVTVGRTRKIHVSLVIDCSGSMSGIKITNAAIASMAMSKALDGMPGVTYDVVGFTTREDTYKCYLGTSERTEKLTHWVFKNKGEKSIEGLRRLTTNTGVGLCNNCDGESIRWAARRIMNEPVDRRIMIVFSDGAPAFHLYTEGPGNLHASLKSIGFQDMREAVAACERAGIETIGVGIGGYDGVTQFYPKNTLCEDTSQLGPKILRLLTEVL